MNGTRTERHGRWRAALLAVALAFGLTGQGAVAAAPLADPLAVEAALADLQSTEWLLRYAALQTLVRHGVNPGEPLRRLVREEPRPWLRGQALLALVRLGDPTGRAQTVALATAPEPELRQAVMLALPSLGRNDETAKLLQAGLADPVPAVRQHALLALPALDGATALPTLVERLDGPDAVTASFAARALADIRTPAARTALLAALRHPDALVREAAAAALGANPGPEVIAPLFQALATDAFRGVRDAAGKALAAQEPEALRPALLAAFERFEKCQYDYCDRLLDLIERQPAPALYARLAVLATDPPKTLDLRALPRLFAVLCAQDEPCRHAALFRQYLKHELEAVRVQAGQSLAACAGTDLYAAFQETLTAADPVATISRLTLLREQTDAPPAGGVVAYLAPLLTELARQTTPHDAVAAQALALLGERLEADDLDAAIARCPEVLRSSSADSKERQRFRLGVLAALERGAEPEARTRLAAARGCFTEWQVIAPFPNDLDHTGLTTVYPPEREQELTRSYSSLAPFAGAGLKFELGPGAVNKEARPCLLIFPPSFTERREEAGDLAGSLVADFAVTLPAGEDVRFEAALAICDPERGANLGNGVRVTWSVDGVEVARTEVVPETREWRPLGVDLSRYAGRAVTLQLAVNALGYVVGDRLAIAAPVVRVGVNGPAAVDLLKLAPQAVVSALPDGDTPRRAAWQAYTVKNGSGQVIFRDVVAPPATFKVGYALTTFTVPATGRHRLALAGSEKFRAWLDGVPVEIEARALAPGPHTLLLKVAAAKGAWWGSAALEPYTGR